MMLMNDSRALAFGVLTVLACLASQPPRVGADEPAALEGYAAEYDRYLQEQADEDAPSAPYDRQVLFLAELQGTLDGHAFYHRVFERLEQMKSPDSLPALEALLNRNISNFRRDSDQKFVRGFRKRATRLWYEIQWPDADKDRRVEMALMGLQPDAEVYLHPGVSTEYVTSLGMAVRGQLMTYLKRENVSYRANARSLVASTYTAKLFAEIPGIAPDTKDFKAILDSGNPFGRLVMINYLADHRGSPRAAGLIVDWIDEYRPMKDWTAVGHAIVNAVYLTKLPDLQRAALAQELADLGEEIQREIQNGDYGLETVSLLSRTNHVLYKLGETDDAKAYFTNYQQFKNELDLEKIAHVLRHDPSILRSFEATLPFAHQYADQALAEWN
ncbi:MAG: hypothetical protein GVY36_18585 [Verrucomicrobia bacterium]|jgi:hypothetical protein|nr:hypothetical protein [Verrucomicrobiota bacterium]